MLDLRDKFCESLSGKIGAPGNQIALILTMLCVIPFCFLNYFIHGKKIRLIYSLVLGFLFQYSIYKFNTIHILISGIYTYLFIKFCGRKYSAFYILIFSLLHLSYLHVKRMYRTFEGWKIDDPTTIYMMSICKFSSIAFSYEDGEKKDEEFKDDALDKHLKEYKIVEKPSFLEILSFTYFYPTSIIGPSIEYKDFINFINEEDCYSRLNENIFYIIKNGILYFFGSFAAMGFYAVISNKLPVSKVSEEEFGEHNLFYILAYIYFCIPAIRARYYSGWLLSYATVIFSGAAYTEKKDKEGKIEKSLEKGSYGSIVTCEWGINPCDLINEWNKTIHLWLKFNVYARVIKIKKKPFENNKTIASFLTFFASAIWHGYYLTYYITFCLLYFLQSGAVVYYKIGLYKWIRDTKLWIPFASIFNGLAFETIGIFFFNLTYDKALIGAKNMRYYPFIAIIGFYIISKMIKVPKREKKVPTKTIENENKNKKVE